jgi:hypothetical protein
MAGVQSFVVGVDEASVEVGLRRVELVLGSGPINRIPKAWEI